MEAERFDAGPSGALVHGDEASAQRESAATVVPRGELLGRKRDRPVTRERSGADLPIAVPNGIEPRRAAVVGRQRELVASRHQADEQETLLPRLTRRGKEQPRI